MGTSDAAKALTPMARLPAHVRESVMQAGTVIALPAGEVLFRQNDSGDNMYIIEDGEIEIRIDRGAPVKLLGPGQYLGEISLLVPGVNRTATAVAHTDCRLRVISQDLLETLKKEQPELLFSLLQETCGYLVASERELLIATSGQQPEKSGATGAHPTSLVVEDPSMQQLHTLLGRVATGGINVLLLGETGVGKEVFAEQLHALSPRASGPLVRVNCAAFSTSLLESELFGHEKGAFTGATTRKLGLLEAASGGMVFLDEVGELALDAQAKLLRVIEEKQIRRVGSVLPIDIDVVFVSATNRNLEELAEAGQFRSDLFYRLNGFSLTIPPLRERRSEIIPLARGFIAAAATRMNLPAAPTLTADASALLLGHRWPGNIRELRNVMDCAALLATGSAIEPEHLPGDRLRSRPAGTLERALVRTIESGDVQGLTDEERAHRQKIVEALAESHGNQTRAAESLGISRRWLSTKMARYKISRPKN